VSGRHDPFEHSKLRKYGKPLSQNQIKIYNQHLKFQLNVSLSAVKTKSNQQSDRKIHQKCHLLVVDIEVDVEEVPEPKQRPELQVSNVLNKLLDSALLPALSGTEVALTSKLFVSRPDSGAGTEDQGLSLNEFD
jgi:hypothetical protein